MDGGGHVGIERAKKSQGESRHCMLLFLQQLLLEQVSAQLFALLSLSSVGCKFKKNAALSMSLVYITMMGLLIVSARLSNMKGYVVLFMLGFFWVAAICTFLFQHGLASLTHMLFVLVLG
jgi:hypothetical protein